MLSPKRLIEPRSKQEFQIRPRDSSKKVRKGVVVHVNDTFGRILCSRSFSDRGAIIFFDRNTVVNGTPLFMCEFPLNAVVPVGVDVDFKLNYEFPSRWRQFGSSMGYYCEWLNYDREKTCEINCTEIIVKTHKQDSYVVATDRNGSTIFIHPHVHPSHTLCRKLYLGWELEPRTNHRYNVLTQPARTLLASIRAVPSFLKAKMKNADYMCLSFLPYSTATVVYAELVAVGNDCFLFDTVGTKENGDDDGLPFQIIMDRSLLLEALGISKANASKLNLYELIGHIFQLGIMLNIPFEKYPYRAYCAYLVYQRNMPNHPTLKLPKPITQRKDLSFLKNFVCHSTPLSPSKNQFLKSPNTSFNRGTHKFSVRRSIRISCRKRIRPISSNAEASGKRRAPDLTEDEEISF